MNVVGKYMAINYVLPSESTRVLSIMFKMTKFCYLSSFFLPVAVEGSRLYPHITWKHFIWLNKCVILINANFSIPHLFDYDEHRTAFVHFLDMLHFRPFRQWLRTKYCMFIFSHVTWTTYLRVSVRAAHWQIDTLLICHFWQRIYVIFEVKLHHTKI